MRVKLERLLIGVQRVGVTLQPPENLALARPGDRVIGHGVDRLVAHVERILVATQTQQWIKLVQPVPDVGRVFLGGALIAQDRILAAIHLFQGQSFAVPGPGIMRIDGERFVVGSNGLLKPSQSPKRLPAFGPAFGVRLVDAQRLVEHVQRLVEPLKQKQFVGLVITVPHVCRVFCRSPFEALVRIFVATKRAERLPFTIPGPGVMRIEHQGALVGRDRFVQPVQPPPRLSEFGPGAVMARIERQDLFEDWQRLFVAAGADQRVRLVVAVQEFLRRNLGGAVVSRNGVVRPLQRFEHDPFFVPGPGIMRIG
jgi:hypothetical protein